MRINAKNFFSGYIINCFSKDLSYDDRVKCFALSILLAPLTLGIAHLVGYIWSRYKLKIISDKFRLYSDNKSRFEQTVQRTDEVFRSIVSKSPSLQIPHSRMPEIAEEILNIFYAKPFPSKSDATVTVNEKEVKWSSLPKDKKIQLLIEHRKLSGPISSLFPDQLFYGSTTNKVYLKTDPRQSHGKDHAMRAALFALVFAYLYSKYKKVKLTQNELVQIQIAALLHDSGRNTDGVDLWDNQSAKNAEKYLGGMHLQEDYIRTISEAIKTQDGSLVGKSLQNADSAEYARLLLKAPDQEQDGFEKSRKYLCIDKENIEDENFISELDTIRHEMNQLIWETHQKSVRESLSESQNYYKAFLKKIDKISYPSLHYILSQLNIIKQIQHPSTTESRPVPLSQHKKIENKNIQLIKKLEHEVISSVEIGSNEARMKLINAGLTDVWSNNPLYDPSTILSKPESTIKILYGGGTCVRKRRIRYAKTRKGFQITFELPSRVREQWELRRQLLNLDSKSDDIWGNNWQLTTDGIEISIGSDKNLWNSYHLVRIETDSKITPQFLHQALCAFGLPTALLPDQAEDLSAEATARMKAIKLKFDPSEIYYRGGEMLNATLPLRAWKNGARAFMSFINGGDIKKTAEVIVSIAKNGLLSTQERLLMGIEGFGNNPEKLMKAGSANQVFTRILMEGQFKKKTKFEKFAVNGLVMVLLDIQLFERVPYSYVEDNIGVRNPYFNEIQLAQKQGLGIVNGKDKKENRPGFHKLLKTLYDRDHLLNESMFDWSVPPHYINRFVVWTKNNKTAITRELMRNGIGQFNGKSLDDFILVADRLDSSMLEGEKYDN